MLDRKGSVEVNAISTYFSEGYANRLYDTSKNFKFGVFKSGNFKIELDFTISAVSRVNAQAELIVVIEFWEISAHHQRYPINTIKYIY